MTMSDSKTKPLRVSVLVPVTKLFECARCFNLRGGKRHPMLPDEPIPDKCECRLYPSYEYRRDSDA